MKTNRFLLSVVVTIIAAIGISSCTYRASYNPGYDYGYRPHYGYRHHVAPPPRVVVVKPRHHKVIRADRYRSSRHDSKHYRQQYNRGNHYGQRNRSYGPR